MNCEEHIILPEGLKRIYMDCFQEGQLRSVVFPQSLVEIGNWVFMDCRMHQPEQCYSASRRDPHQVGSFFRLYGTDAAGVP